MKKIASMNDFEGNDLESRAAEALRTTLGQVSFVKIIGIRRTSERLFEARIEVLGRRYTLACQVRESAAPEKLRATLGFRDQTGAASGSIPVLIAPYLSPEAQAVCNDGHMAFVDMAGNARLSVGEVFIGQRSMAPRRVEAARMNYSSAA